MRREVTAAQFHQLDVEIELLFGEKSHPVVCFTRKSAPDTVLPFALHLSNRPKVCRKDEPTRQEKRSPLGLLQKRPINKRNREEKLSLLV